MCAIGSTFSTAEKKSWQGVKTSRPYSVRVTNFLFKYLQVSTHVSKRKPHTHTGIHLSHMYSLTTHTSTYNVQY